MASAEYINKLRKLKEDIEKYGINKRVLSNLTKKELEEAGITLQARPKKYTRSQKERFEAGLSRKYRG